MKPARRNQQWMLTHTINISSSVRHFYTQGDWLNNNSSYLPAPGCQVLQGPGSPLQCVWVWALRQQGEVGLHYWGVPQHLNPLGGLSSVRQGSHTIPLYKNTWWWEKQWFTQNLSLSTFKRGFHSLNWSNIEKTLIMQMSNSIAHVKSLKKNLQFIVQVSDFTVFVWFYTLLLKSLKKNKYTWSPILFFLNMYLVTKSFIVKIQWFLELKITML